MNITPPHCLLRWPLGLLALLTIASASLSAKSDEWTDTKGTSFTGKPVELIGPYALFRVEGSGRPVPLMMLKPEDCFRFYEEIHDKPVPAESWDKANGLLTTECIGALLEPAEGDRFVPFNFKAHTEPEFVLAVFVNQNEERQRDMVAALIEPYQKLKKRFGGRVEAVFFDAHQSRIDHAAIARYMKMPWPISDTEREYELRIFTRYEPQDDFGLAFFSRQGDPILVENAPHDAEVNKMLDNINGLMDAIRPENTKSWGQRVYYWGAVQKRLFDKGHSDPLLIGNPLIPAGLIQRKISRLDADIAVAATGQITSVKVQPDPGLPEKLAPALADGLKMSALVPAVDNGNFVDGIYHYHFQATP